MADMLEDELSLAILEKICDGVGVSINVSALAKSLDRHRNTIKSQVTALFENGILTAPYYPFTGLFKERPLFSIVRADLPRQARIDKFLAEDDTIFASFKSWDDGYNTLLFEFHKSMSSYFYWKEKIVEDDKLPPLENRFPADVVFVNNELLFKYDPNSSIACMDKRFDKDGELILNGYKLNELGFNILKKLLAGEGIKTNEHLLSKELDTHRKTIEKRIEALTQAGLITQPVCRFPQFCIPPGHVFVVSFIRIDKCKEQIIQYIRDDPCVPIAYRGHVGKYNLLYFGVFPNVEEHFNWEEILHAKFKDECFGVMKKIYLSENMTVSIDRKKVSFGVLKEKIAELDTMKK